MARPARITLPSTIDRADVSATVSRCVGDAGTAADVRCDGSRVRRAGIPAVEATARIALLLRRDRRSFRLEHATPELLDLLDLCGLRDCLAGDDRRPPS